MSSAKKFDMLRTVISVLIALGISLVLIFFISEQPLEAIKHLITGPLTSRRNFGQVIEAMIPLVFTGTGVCIMFAANQINLSAEGGFYIGGLAASCVAIYVKQAVVYESDVGLSSEVLGPLFTGNT